MGIEVHLSQCYWSKKREDGDKQRPDHEGPGGQLGLYPLPISHTEVFLDVLTSMPRQRTNLRGINFNLIVCNLKQYFYIKITYIIIYNSKLPVNKFRIKYKTSKNFQICTACHHPPTFLPFRVFVRGHLSCMALQKKSFRTTVLNYGQSLKDFKQRNDKVRFVF